MGSACCVAARDGTLPNRASSETVYRNVRYSPSWSVRWDNRGRVAGEVDNPPNLCFHRVDENVGLETKGGIYVQSEDVSDGGSPLENRTPLWQKSLIHEGMAGNSTTPASDVSRGSSFSTEGKDLIESSAVAVPSASNPSFSIPSSSSLSMFKADPLSSQSHPLPVDSTPSRQTCLSPGDQLSRQVSDNQIPGLKSPNNSVSEGRQSFVLSTCSNDLTLGSHGGSSDGWSMCTFSELVASSQRERWSFDSENLGSSCGKVTLSNSRLLASPSIDLQTCGVCSKLLTERSSWSSQKIIASNDLSVVSVLVCGHVYHAECLENMTPETARYDPSCPVCTAGDKQTLKMSGKALRTEADMKARNNKISRSRVVDSNLDGDCVVSDHRKSTGRDGKGPKMGASSSMRSSFARPFLRRHFSFGSKPTRSIFENESSSRKGFWARYRKD